jgi:hypothetical protein
MSLSRSIGLEAILMRSADDDFMRLALGEAARLKSGSRLPGFDSRAVLQC